MKKSSAIITTLLLILCISVSLIALSGCQSQETFGDTDTATIVVGSDEPVEYKVSLKGLKRSVNLFELLDAAESQHGLTYKSSDKMLTEVGSLKSDADKGIYLCIYTSVEKDYDVSDYATTIEYKEQTLTFSGVGAEDMTILKDCIIYIGTLVFK